jgi:hypothetical protein
MHENCSWAGASGRPAGPGAAVGVARRNLRRNVRRGVHRSGSAGNIERYDVPYLWTKNVGLWTIIAFMDKKCIYGQERSIYGQEMYFMDKKLIFVGKKIIPALHKEAVRLNSIFPPPFF